MTLHLLVQIIFGALLGVLAVIGLLFMLAVLMGHRLLRNDRKRESA